MWLTLIILWLTIMASHLSIRALLKECIDEKLIFIKEVRVKKNRFKPILFVLLIVASVIISCSTKTGYKGATYKHLKAYIDQIKVINTHEHQQLIPEPEREKVNVFTLIKKSYLNADLISAGSPKLDSGLIADGDYEKLWERYGRYLDFTRDTSYYRHLVDGFRILYGFNEIYFTKDNIKELSSLVRRNYLNFDEWYDQAFQKANFELMFIDPWWDQFKTDSFYKHFAMAMRLDQYINSISERSRLEKTDASTFNNPFYQAKKENYEIRTLEDYLAFADQWFQKFVAKKAVCAKTANAYERNIYYEDVPFKEAESLFARPSDKLTPGQKKRLQDFMFHWCIQKCIEYDLPIQIHTGYLAGNRNTLEKGKPMKLNNIFLKYREAKFSLFHGGYPWYTEIGALAKSFPNVYIDIVWLPQISREASVAALHQWLDCTPYNKFFWGGDCSIIEGSAGAVEYGRDVLAQVLAERVDAGRMSIELAKEIAVKILRKNAIRVFKLEEKLGRKFD